MGFTVYILWFMVMLYGLWVYIYIYILQQNRVGLYYISIRALWKFGYIQLFLSTNAKEDENACAQIVYFVKGTKKLDNTLL